MHKNILKTLDKVVEQLDDDKYPMITEKQHLIQGVKIAQQVIKTEQRNSRMIAYKTFENAARSLQDTLDYEEAVEIINDVYWDKN